MSDPKKLIEVRNIITHPDFEEHGLNNDIGHSYDIHGYSCLKYHLENIILFVFIVFDIQQF